jgi:hypothetical protein
MASSTVLRACLEFYNTVLPAIIFGDSVEDDTGSASPSSEDLVGGDVPNTNPTGLPMLHSAAYQNLQKDWVCCLNQNRRPRCFIKGPFSCNEKYSILCQI